MRIELPLHSVPVTEYNAILRRLYLRRNGWWIALIAVACIAASVVDDRLMIAGLLTLLVVMPMVFALIYFYYGLTLESRYSVLEKTIVADDSGLRLDFTQERMEGVSIEWSRFNRYAVMRKFILLHFYKPYQFLAVPLSVFEDDKENLRRFATLAQDNIHPTKQ